MDILKTLSIKNLKLNKKRTISTIIGIMLSVALICAVATMFTSFQETLVQDTINGYGYYHLKISNVTDKDINELQNNRKIKDIYTVNELGYAKLENCENENKPYLKVFSTTLEGFENLKFKLIEGRIALNSNEVVISNHIATNGKVNYKVGDKIKLEIGTRKTLDGYKLEGHNPYNGDEYERLVDTKEKEFTIVGIIERPNYEFEEYSDPGYTIITANMESENKIAYISLKNPKEYKTSIAQILGVSEYREIYRGDPKYEEFSVNDELLRWEVFAFSDSTVSMFAAIIGVVIFIIMFTSIFCIRNSFAIATTEKIKMYGMLASIGTTKKQIKKSVIFEAMILGVVGIPLGILLGILAVFILMQIVNFLIGDYLLSNVSGIIVKVSIYPIIVSVILGALTIYLSAISSARKASKVTPIEGIRNNNEIKIKRKKLKTPKIITKIFKTGGTLAYKNLKRSKKKYRTTVISIAVSIGIFISMNTMLTNMFGFTRNYYEDYDYNFIISGLYNKNPDEIKQILSLENIDEKYVTYTADEGYKIRDWDKVSSNEVISSYYEYRSYYDDKTGEIVEEDPYITLRIIGLDDETFRKYAKKIGANYEEVKSTGILCDDYKYFQEDKIKHLRIYKYEEGDLITGKFGEEELGIKVGKITDIMPYGSEGTRYMGGCIIVNINEFKDIPFTMEDICIQTSNPNVLEEKVDDLKLDVHVYNIAESVKEEKSMILVINIFLYGFITVITLIGVTNIFNTITSNMELRQTEFAMLKSIGMTKKEFNRMINLETIMYSTKALLYGITLGLLGTFAMYKAFSIKVESDIYIPVKPIIISIVAVFILVYVIMKYSINKINKQSTIETIRKENI